MVADVPDGDNFATWSSNGCAAGEHVYTTDGVMCFCLYVIFCADADSDSGQGAVVADTPDSEDLLASHHPVTVQQEYVYATDPPPAPPSRVISAGQVSSSFVRGPPPVHVTTQSRSVVSTVFQN